MGPAHPTLLRYALKNPAYFQMESKCDQVTLAQSSARKCQQRFVMLNTGGRRVDSLFIFPLYVPGKAICARRKGLKSHLEEDWLGGRVGE